MHMGDEGKHACIWSTASVGNLNRSSLSSILCQARKLRRFRFSSQQFRMLSALQRCWFKYDCFRLWPRLLRKTDLCYQYVISHFMHAFWSNKLVEIYRIQFFLHFHPGSKNGSLCLGICSCFCRQTGSVWCLLYTKWFLQLHGDSFECFSQCRSHFQVENQEHDSCLVHCVSCLTLSL